MFVRVNEIRFKVFFVLFCFFSSLNLMGGFESW